MLKRRVQFCESYEKKVQFCESRSFFYKSSILWVIKVSIIWLIFLSKSILRVIFFFFKKGLILWDIWKIKFKSSSHSLKEDSIPWVILKKRFNTLSHIQRKVRFFESYSTKSLSHSEKKKKAQFFESSKKSSILSHERSSILWVIFEKGSILWVKKYFLKKNFESYSKKGEILWVMEKKVLRVIFQKRFNSLSFVSHILQEKFNSLSNIEKEV